MTATDRRVRHLRLRAGSQADVRHVLPVLEDALRCASLPDTGSRLLLVRRLALGRLARNVSPQALAQLIEQRVAALGGQWVEGGTPAAAGAAYVSFAGALEARIQLAVRIARGAPHAEWYWPLAVPELRAAQAPGEALRHIAWTLAQWPEACRALPAWVAALVQAGAGGALAAAIDAPAGKALLRQAGLAMPQEPAAPAPGQAASADRSPEALAHRPHPPHAHGDGEPRWLRTLLAAAAPGRPVLPLPSAARAPRPVGVNPAAAQARHAGVREGAALSPGRVSPPATAAAGSRPAAPPGTEGAAQTQAIAASVPTGVAGDGPEPSPRQSLRGTDPPAPSPSGTGPAAGAPLHLIDALPTSCAGLLFLLPVLARLGLPQWLAGTQDSGFAQRVLQHALRRLRASPDDPAWLLAPADASAQGLHAPAPACWHDPLLAGAPALTQALQAAPGADAQAAVWLTATRRWLRRAGRIGLASLVRRPGCLGLTPTHADMHFRLQDTDLRVRRLGLDIDPGWLPWFGRVVTFHYRRSVPW